MDCKKQAVGHIWPVGNSLSSPDFEETECKEENAMLQNKMSKSVLVTLGCNNYQHTAINMISLVILHMEGILITECPLIS